MARKLRVQYPGAIYQVMNRGDRREPNAPETSVTLAGLAPGEHRFKAFGENAQGIGPESAEAVAAIAQAQAA